MLSDATPVNSIDLAAKEAVARLQEAQQKVEARLKSRAEDYQKRFAELRSSIEGLQRHSDAMLEGFQGQLQNTLQAAQQKAMKDVANELKKVAKELLKGSANQLQEQADATMAAFEAELKASRQAFVDETQKQLASVTQAPLESLTQATIEESRSQLTQFFQEQAQMARQNADAALNSIHLAAREALAELQAAQQNVPKEVAKELEKVAQDLLKGSAQQLQEQAGATVAALEGELRASRQGFIEDTKKQLASVTQASLESLTQAATQECRSQLSQMLKEFLARGVRELESEHAGLLKKHRQAIQKQIDDLKARLDEQRREFIRFERTPKLRVASLWGGLKVWLGVVAMTLILVVVYVSTRPVVQLRVEPPAVFFDDRPDWNAKRRAREDQLARAYWNCAVRDVQAKYRFGMTLPDEPPAEFRVEEKGLPGNSLKVDPVARARYWEKLRQVWVLPEAWQKSTGWNTDWIHSALSSAYAKPK